MWPVGAASPGPLGKSFITQLLGDPQKTLVCESLCTGRPRPQSNLGLFLLVPRGRCSMNPQSIRSNRCFRTPANLEAVVAAVVVAVVAAMAVVTAGGGGSPGCRSLGDI